MRMVLARALAAAFWLITAVYALLSAIPFASKHFLEPQLLPALNAFAAWHAQLSIVVCLAIALLLWRSLAAKDPGPRWLLGAWVGIALIELATPGLGALQPSWVSAVVAVAALIPPVVMAWLPASGSRAALSASGAGLQASGFSGDQTAVVADFAACVLAAVIVAIAHSVVGVSFAGATPTATAIGESVGLHLIAFSATFAALSVIRGVARMTLHPLAVERWLTTGLLAIVTGLLIDQVVLGPLSFTGPRAAAIATAFGIALALLMGPRVATPMDGVSAAVAGLVPAWAAHSWRRAAVWMTLVMLSIAAAERLVAGSDWNLSIAKLLSFVCWLLILAAALRALPHVRWTALPKHSLVSVGPFVACLLVLMVQQMSARGDASEARPAGSRAIDVSSRLILDALAPPASVDDGLYDYLQRNTNIARDVAVAPAAVDLARLPGASSPWRPHIFLFVVDSLRRDYLSPYNDRVNFTPAIARFAGESTVFERAFTRYGATGLSVPSIWTGGMLLHKQYVTPFRPMNALLKLAEAETYQQWFSVDSILDVIAPSPMHREPLDGTTMVKDYRLCGTLDEVRGRLDRLASTREPAFVYSLPQDIHVSTIAREGSRSIDDRSYGPFNAPYASRIRRFDACFGQFIDDLKTKGLFDDSLIVLTADHGDSLGEEGRMGHAYTIFPEILQVPLIVHLPARLRGEFRADSRAVAFTSDLTPTVYRLLGHEPARPASFFGEPLYRRAGDPPRARPEADVVASSYGSVYGALLDDARRLYIIDGVSFREYEYELDGTGAGRVLDVRSADRAAAQRAIRATVGEIATFFKYPQGAGR